MDADFIGTSNIAQELQRSLGSPWKLRKGSKGSNASARDLLLYRRGEMRLKATRKAREPRRALKR
jgi:hypothetical protein